MFAILGVFGVDSESIRGMSRSSRSKKDSLRSGVMLGSRGGERGFCRAKEKKGPLDLDAMKSCQCLSCALMTRLGGDLAICDLGWLVGDLAWLVGDLALLVGDPASGVTSFFGDPVCDLASDLTWLVGDLACGVTSLFGDPACDLTFVPLFGDLCWPVGGLP